MKRYIFLTSALVLAACGGGSGGGGGVSGTVASASVGNATAELFNGVIGDAATTSNQNITNMTSGIVVSTGGGSSVIRSGSVTSGGHTFNVYDLSDVKFIIADNPDQGYFKFKIDTDNADPEKRGRITQITQHLGNRTNTVDRIGETQRFNGPIFEYVSNENDGVALHRVPDDGTITMDDLEEIAATGVGGHWNRIDEVLNIGTIGGNAVESGLTFSDFGKFHPVYRSKHKNIDADTLAALRSIPEGETVTVEEYIQAYLDNPANTNTTALETWLTTKGLSTELIGGNHKYRTSDERDTIFTNSQDYQLFAGGYAIKNGLLVDTLTPTGDMHFTGKAIGRVYTSIQSDSVDRGALLQQYQIPYYTEDGEHNKTYYLPNGSGGFNSYAAGDVPSALASLAESAEHIDDAGHDLAQYYEASGATLTFDGSTNTATVVMPFAANGFYDVTATKVGDAAITVAFSNKSDDLPEYLARDTDTPDSTETTGNFGYYGIDTPSEAAGTIKQRTEKVLSGSADDPDAWREWEFQGAYGMKKDN